MSQVDSCLIPRESNNLVSKVDNAVDLAIELVEELKQIKNVTVGSFEEIGIKSCKAKIIFKLKGHTGK